MNLEKVNIDTATETINSWLDYKRVRDGKRVSYKASIETMIDAVREGSLVLDEETKELKYKLLFPIESEVNTTELTFKPRLKVSAVNSRMRSVKSTDADARVTVYISALTGLPPALVESVETEDYDICQAIAVFFM